MTKIHLILSKIKKTSKKFSRAEHSKTQEEEKVSTHTQILSILHTNVHLIIDKEKLSNKEKLTSKAEGL